MGTARMAMTVLLFWPVDRNGIKVLFGREGKVLKEVNEWIHNKFQYFRIGSEKVRLWTDGKKYKDFTTEINFVYKNKLQELLCNQH